MTEPTEIYPKCGETTHAEFVDNGFGPHAVQVSPFHCKACGWTDSDYSAELAGAPGSGWGSKGTLDELFL
jgi:hypothetical protein